MEVKIAYYRRKDWKRFLKMADDSEKMHDSWDGWNGQAEKLKQELTNKGFNVAYVVVDLDELTQYCKHHKIKNNGEARSQFVQK